MVGPNSAKYPNVKMALMTTCYTSIVQLTIQILTTFVPKLFRRIVLLQGSGSKSNNGKSMRSMCARDRVMGQGLIGNGDER